MAKNDAQRRFFHLASQRAEIAPKTIVDFHLASKGLKLPEKVLAMRPKPKKKPKY